MKTDDKIIKALENCLDCSPSCTSCKYDADTLTSSECMGALMKDSLDLINRQKAEIADLKSDLLMKTNDYENTKSLYENSIKIGQKMNEKLIDAYKKLQTAKSEARKEFWNRLKTRNTMDKRIISVESGDNLLKEMEKENE